MWLLVSSCSAPEQAPAAVRERLAARPTTKVAAPAPLPLYDGTGNLLGSGERVAWLELPRGLTKLDVSSGTFHAYRAEGIASDLMQAFFGSRLIAGQVTRLGANGVLLARGIPPSGSKPKQSLIDVTVVPGVAPDELSVRIVEHPWVPPAPQFSDADARALMKEERKRAE